MCAHSLSINWAANWKKWQKKVIDISNHRTAEILMKHILKTKTNKLTKREPEFFTHFRPIVRNFRAKTTTNRDWSFCPPLCVRLSLSLFLALCHIQSASCSLCTSTSCSCVCLWVCLAVCTYIYAKVCVCVCVCWVFFPSLPQWVLCCEGTTGSSSLIYLPPPPLLLLLLQRDAAAAACTHCCCCCYLDSRIVAARRRRRRRFELWGLSFWVECTPERCLNAASVVRRASSSPRSGGTRTLCGILSRHNTHKRTHRHTHVQRVLEGLQGGAKLVTINNAPELGS